MQNVLKYYKLINFSIASPTIFEVGQYISRRKFDVESKYAHNFSVKVRVKMFQIKTVFNFRKVNTYFGTPCIRR